MHSAIFEGQLRHRRFTPREHEFEYPLFLMYVDLAELDVLFQNRWFWSTHRFALAQFDRTDHMGNPQERLDQTVRNWVQAKTGSRPEGPIRLLTHLRYFGYCFNPVSFYYCFNADGCSLHCVVAEVNNTPWGEQHCYVLQEPQAPLSDHYYRYQSLKCMHVSPFLPMQLLYRWGFSLPGEDLNVHMVLQGLETDVALAGKKMFDVTMRLKRRSINGRALARILLKYPFMTLQVMGAIHWQALRLWLKGVNIFTHPQNKS